MNRDAKLPPTVAPREHFAGLASSPHSVGFLFGSERFGMSNDDVYRCHAALSIPTAPDYGSLNLAAAIQVIAYEWRTALGGFGPPAVPQRELADAQESLQIALVPPMSGPAKGTLTISWGKLHLSTEWAAR